ncbi:MAG: hypothetical protein JSS86_04960 [Cyanobacteria bacterium SZAS LIN-2]|nr:hypothetical protein [Cyanobacteria bacterium SZAS LIN-2]
MTPELRDTVRADNSMDRVTAAPTATEAYEALQAEVSKNMSTPGDNSRYWQNLKSVVNPAWMIWRLVSPMPDLPTWTATATANCNWQKSVPARAKPSWRG